VMIGPAPHRGRIAVSSLIAGASAGFWQNAPNPVGPSITAGTHGIRGPRPTIHSGFPEISVSAPSVFAGFSGVIDRGGRLGVARASKKQAVPVSGRGKLRDEAV
jgi:hypothetical protein